MVKSRKKMVRKEAERRSRETDEWGREESTAKIVQKAAKQEEKEMKCKIEV